MTTLAFFLSFQFSFFKFSTSNILFCPPLNKICLEPSILLCKFMITAKAIIIEKKFLCNFLNFNLLKTIVTGIIKNNPILLILIDFKKSIPK